MLIYQIETTADDLRNNYRAFGAWEPASDLDETYFVTVEETRADTFEHLLDADATVISYKVVQDTEHPIEDWSLL